mgnify:CR=1 FL=1
MKATGTVEMFSRSEQDELRYTTFSGVGDSAVETALKTEVRYGGLNAKKVHQP